MLKGLIASIALVAASFEPAAAQPLAQTGSGTLVGKSLDGVEAFLGVPYAAAPTGASRWRAPGALPRWQGRRDASRFGAACMQAVAQPWGPYTAEFVAGPPMSEDCLFLNIWKPEGGRGRLPVLVFIPGGAFAGGAGHVPVYDGARLARRGLVVVTINYRVGVFGFLAHPALRAEGQGNGNFGLLDQVAALRWIRANVSRFGGDPARVTIAGESAGAASVNDLQVMPSAKGLFRAAISFSGASMAIDAPSLSEGEREGQAFAERLSARTMADMRAIPAERLVDATRLIPGSGPLRLVWVPHVDGRVLPADPADPAAPRASRVPLLTGFNADEMIDFSVRTPADFVSSVRRLYGAFADRLLTLYPHADEADVAASNGLLARDRYMAGLLVWAGARDKGVRDRIWLYRHDHAFPAAPGGRSFGAFHTSHLPYVFGNIGLGGRTFGVADGAVVQAWQDRIAAFARSADPALPDQPWSAMAAGTTQVMAIGQTQGPSPAVSSPERLAAWREYAASGGRLGLM